METIRTTATGTRSADANRHTATVRAAKIMRSAGVIAMFFLLTALGAQVRIPLPGSDVPMTLQLPAVLLTGLWLSPSRAVMVMILYLGAGAAGWPVFAPQSAGLWGITGGYLFGFLVAAWLIAMVRGRVQDGFFRLLAAATIGTVVVFGFGVAWRLLFFGKLVTAVLSMGLLPFVPKACIEILLAVGLVTSVRGFAGKRRGDA